MANKADIDRAVAIADEAFRRGPWSTFMGPQRAACLSKFADLVEQNAEGLARAESIATGRPIGAILGFDLKHMVQVYRCKQSYECPLGRPCCPSPNSFFSRLRWMGGQDCWTVIRRGQRLL